MALGGGINVATLQATLVADTTRFTAGMAAARGQAATTAGSMGRVGAAGSAMGARLVAVGRLLRVPALALAAVGVGAIKMGADFDDSMNKIVRLVGVSKSQVNAWKKDILALAPQVAKSPKELADAMFFITSAGLKGKDALNALKASAKASASGLGETKVVADAVTSAMNAYGPKIVSASKATDILTGTVKAGKIESQELAPALGRVLPVASELGVKFTDVGGAVAALSRKGLNASEAVTGLRGIMNKLLKPTEQGKEALAQVGLSADDLRKSVRERGLLATLVDLRDKFGGNSEQLGKVFEDVEALNAVFSLTRGEGREAASVFGQVEQSIGLTDSAFKETSSTIKFQFGQAVAWTQAQLVNLGTWAIPLIQTAVQEMAKFFQAHREDIMAFGHAVGSAFSSAAAAVQVAWPLISVALETIIGQLRGAAEIIKGIVQVIAGILTLDFSLAWEGVKAIFGGAITSILSRLHGLTASLRIIGEVIGTLLSGAFTRARDAVVSVVGAMKDRILAVGHAILQFFTALPGLLLAALAQLPGVGEFVASKMRAIRDFIVGVAVAVFSAAKALGAGISQGIRDGVAGIADWVKGRISSIKDFLGTVVGGFTNAAAAIGGAIKDGIVGGVHGVVGAVKGVINGISGVINWFIDKFNAVFQPRRIGLGPVAVTIPGVTIPHIPALARGTSDFGGGLAVVGERGPELVSLPKHSQVFPNVSPMTPPVTAMGGTPTVSVAIHGDAGIGALIHAVDVVVDGKLTSVSGQKAVASAAAGGFDLGGRRVTPRARRTL